MLQFLKRLLLAPGYAGSLLLVGSDVDHFIRVQAKYAA